MTNTKVTLSSTARAELASLSVPLDPTRQYALYEVLEAAAKATGKQVVSDYYWQPPRDLQEPSMVQLYGSPSSLLDWLTLHTLARCERRELRWAGGCPSPWEIGWDWGDAGDFLRFRSRERSLWRASFLSPDLLARLNKQVDQYLPTRETPEAWGKVLDLTLEMRDYAWLVPRASEAEVRLGRLLAYESPQDPLAQQKRALRELAMRIGLTTEWRGLATFSERQWRAIRGPGLRADLDLRPDQQEALGLLPDPASDRTALQGKIVRLTPEDPPEGPRTTPVSPALAVQERFDILKCPREGEENAGSISLRALQVKLQLPPLPAAKVADASK